MHVRIHAAAAEEAAEAAACTKKGALDLVLNSSTR